MKIKLCHSHRPDFPKTIAIFVQISPQYTGVQVEKIYTSIRKKKDSYVSFGTKNVRFMT